MRREKRWRYYCDHCGKSGGSGGHMKNHESGCTRNPLRLCGMCRRRQQVQGDIDVLKSGYRRPGDEDVQALRDHVGGCPACMLAAVVQSGVQSGPDIDGPGYWVMGFDYKKEKAEWWKKAGERRRAEEELRDIVMKEMWRQLGMGVSSELVP